MKLIQIILIVLLLTSIICKQKNKQPNSYEANRILIPNAITPYSASFVATWLGGYCFNTTKCDNVSLHNWDKQSFTIHGLWPCPKTNRNYSLFHSNNIQDEALLDDMYNYFPPNSNLSNPKRNYFLWKHEYEKHGIDYSHIMQINNPHKYGNASKQTLQEAYFRHAIQFYKSQKLQKIDISRAHPRPIRDKDGNLSVTKEQLAQIIDISTDKFTVYCHGDWLYEIRISLRIHYDLSTSLENWKTIVFQNETSYPVNDLSCPQTFKLMMYKDPATPSQERVTARTIHRGQRQERETIDQQL